MTDKRTFFLSAGAEIDLRLCDLLGELGSMPEAAADRLDDAEDKEIRRESTFQTCRGPVRASAGIRIRSAGRGGSAARGAEEPVDVPINHFRHRPEPQSPAEPHCAVGATIVDEPACWTLVADLPGITRDDLELGSDGEGGLLIEAAGQGRRCRGSFALHEDIGIEYLTCRMHNGILEIVANQTRGNA